MNWKLIFEIIGYVGTALVLLSFLMTSVVKLRIINTIGSLVSIVYGVLVHVYPTVVLNVCLAAINIFYLWKMSGSKSEKIYTAGEVDVKNELLNTFLVKYRDEIMKFFPSFEGRREEANFAKFVFCEDTVAGVLMGHLDPEGTLNIVLDFTTPAYRDFSAGKFSYKELENDGIKKCIFASDIDGSYVYLKKVGFRRAGDVMELYM